MTRWTLEDGVGQNRVDGVQADGAGLRQTDVQTHTQRLRGTVVPTVRPGQAGTEVQTRGMLYMSNSGPRGHIWPL